MASMASMERVFSYFYFLFHYYIENRCHSIHLVLQNLPFPWNLSSGKERNHIHHAFTGEKESPPICKNPIDKRKIFAIII